MRARPACASWLGGLYAALLYGFIFLPVVVLVLFSFQGGRFPVPPFNGPSLKWYEAVLTDGRLVQALVNSLAVASLSSAVACVLGFLAACGLARYHLPGAALQRALIMAPLAVSYLIIGMGLLITFNMMSVSRSLLTVGMGAGGVRFVAHLPQTRTVCPGDRLQVRLNAAMAVVLASRPR